MASSLNVNGEWKDIADVSVKANDEWKQVYTAFTKVDDEWKKVYSIAPLFDFALAIDASSGVSISPITDMSTWTYTSVPYPATSMTYYPYKGYDGEKYFVVGWSSTGKWGNFYTSQDGYLWSHASANPSFNLASIKSSESSATVYGGNGRLFVFGFYNDTCAYSDDGITWTSFTLPYINPNEHAYYAYGNGVHIVYGSTMNSPHTVYLYSTDNGVTWQQGNFSLSKQWDKMIFDGTKFVVMERGGTAIQYSTDGINWQTAYHSVSGQLFDFEYVKSLNQYVVITSNNSYGFLYSSNLTTWSAGSLPEDALYASFIRTTNNALQVGSHITFDLVNWVAPSVNQLQFQVLLSNPY